MNLFGNVTTAENVSSFLAKRHYLGAARRGWAWSDEHGIAVFASPNARHLPADWVELIRWCLVGGKNAGTRQWAAMRAFLLDEYPLLTTVISYSDPSVGHTGALYRACGWVWAPTWHRLRPPPTGNGSWGHKRECVKDRWVACLRRDPRRAAVLTISDESILRQRPELRWQEPRFKRGVAVAGTGGVKP